MSIVYLAVLTAGIGCMLLLDFHYRLYFWRDGWAAFVVTLTGTVFLLLWDAAGIAAGIFNRGDSPIASGIVLAPELPVEEPIFLVFLVQCTMILYLGTVRILRARDERGDDRN